MTGIPNAMPSPVYDNQTVAPCLQWIWSIDNFYEWTSVMPDPVPGYPLYWVNGETVSPNCAFECDCFPGNADSDGAANILDITYLKAYLYKGGPPSAPYQICSGDPNCDCTVNILDITYLISYLYKGGMPPCDCPTWLSLCGPPLS